MTYPVGISSPKLNSNQKGYVTSKSKVIAFKKPGEISEDPLTELLRAGARQLIANAVEAELLDIFNSLHPLKTRKAANRWFAMGICRNGRYKLESARWLSGFQ